MTSHETNARSEDTVEVEILEGEVIEDVVLDEIAPHDLGLELPDDPDEAKALLLRELSESRNDAGEYLETLQRLAADFENYRKRTQRDQADNVERASQRVVERLLPTLDSFDAALAYEPGTPAEDKILDGMRGTHSQLIDSLSHEGCEPIGAIGRPFDPAVHEAVSAPSQGEGTLIVTQELRRGYMLRGRVLRPSLVVVEYENDA